jgi:hypothetical protein
MNDSRIHIETSAQTTLYKVLDSGGLEQGPVDMDQMRKWIMEGRVTANNRVLVVGTRHWKVASDYSELQGMLSSAADLADQEFKEKTRALWPKRIKGPEELWREEWWAARDRRNRLALLTGFIAMVITNYFLIQSSQRAWFSLWTLCIPFGAGFYLIRKFSPFLMRCPHCKAGIQAEAVICPHCRKEFSITKMK